MKEQELRDIFHAYRPEIADNDAFMDKLTAQMDAIDHSSLNIDHSSDAKLMVNRQSSMVSPSFSSTAASSPGLLA